MKIETTRPLTGDRRRISPEASARTTRNAWQKRQDARLKSARRLGQDKARGLAWSLICTGTLWLLLFGGLCLVFKS